MAEIQAPKRINIDDFKPEHKEIIEKLAFSLNTFMEEVNIALKKRINIKDNINQQVKTIANLMVDSDGVPTSSASFKSNLIGKATGLVVIRTFGDSLVITTPFIDFTEDEQKVITMANIKGLTADTEYKLVILLIGD